MKSQQASPNPSQLNPTFPCQLIEWQASFWRGLTFLKSCNIPKFMTITKCVYFEFLLLFPIS